MPARGANPGPGRHTPYAPSLEELLAGAADELPNVVFVFGFAIESDRSRDVDWVRLRSSKAPLDLVGPPLVWLGPAGTQQSLAQLRSLYAALENPALKKEIAAAFSLHEGQEQVVQTVREVVEEEENAEVRSEAVQWLQPFGQYRSRAALNWMEGGGGWNRDPAQYVR